MHRSVPITESSSRFTFLTLRGGGLFVVDSQATPMRIVGEYDQTVVHGNGCLGAESLGKMYIDSGGGTAANLYQADLYVFPLSGSPPTPTRRTHQPPAWSSTRATRSTPMRTARRSHARIASSGWPIEAATSCG